MFDLPDKEIHTYQLSQEVLALGIPGVMGIAGIVRRLMKVIVEPEIVVDGEVIALEIAHWEWQSAERHLHVKCGITKPHDHVNCVTLTAEQEAQIKRVVDAHVPAKL